MLILYRRHTKTCIAHRCNPCLDPGCSEERPCSNRETRGRKSSAKSLRNQMACGCAIWIYGHAGNQSVARQSLGTSDLAVAEAKRQAVLGGGRAPEEVRIAIPTTGELRIDSCIERFLAGHDDQIGDGTARRYRMRLGRLAAYCARRGIDCMSSLTVDLLEDYKAALPHKMAASTKRQELAMVRCFLRTAYRRGWTNVPLADRVAPLRVSHEPKPPYTDEEVRLILDGVDELDGGKRFGYAKKPATFRLLLELMLETGLRVSDAIRFDPSTLECGDARLWIYKYSPVKWRKGKQRAIFETFITERLKKAIERSDWFSPELPFWYGSSMTKTRGETLAVRVYREMQTIGERCGVDDCRPHRLRDTFAVRMLLRGVSIDDVSRLLGHANIQVTQSHYLRWVPARRARLASVFAQSLVNADNNALGNRKRAREPKHTRLASK